METKANYKKYKFGYAKLVRDNIPAMFRRDGFTAKLRRLGRTEYLAELKKKLGEESAEVAAAATAAEVRAEIADVQEVLDCLREVWQITPADLAQERRRKRRTNGGFKKRIYVEYIENGPKSDPAWLKYHLQRRKKYPLIK